MDAIDEGMMFNLRNDGRYYWRWSEEKGWKLDCSGVSCTFALFSGK